MSKSPSALVNLSGAGLCLNRKDVVYHCVVVFIVFLFEPDRRSYEIIKYGLINEMLHDCAAF